jgi:membrane-associated protein
MSLLQELLDLVLHLDRHLITLLMRYDVWIYGILFGVIFAETGFVVTPFLPGDSLLFAVGALCAVDSSGTLRLGPVLAVLALAAVSGNTLNYLIGRGLGQRAFSGQFRWLKLQHLRRTEAFFQRHGGLAVVLSRFVPIVRTFAPFVAGIGRMRFARFQAFNISGGVGWVGLITIGGYLFGNLPLVRNNFGIVTILIIIVSVLPLLWVMWRERGNPANG